MAKKATAKAAKKAAAKKTTAPAKKAAAKKATAKPAKKAAAKTVPLSDLNLKPVIPGAETKSPGEAIPAAHAFNPGQIQPAPAVIETRFDPKGRKVELIETLNDPGAADDISKLDFSATWEIKVSDETIFTTDSFPEAIKEFEERSNNTNAH